MPLVKPLFLKRNSATNKPKLANKKCNCPGTPRWCPGTPSERRSVGEFALEKLAFRSLARPQAAFCGTTWAVTFSGHQAPTSSCIDVWELEQPIGHGRGAHSRPGQARQHRGEVVAPVEAVFELGEIAGHVLRGDHSVGPDDGRLDVTERGVDPLERSHTGRGGAGTSLDHLMVAARLAHR